MFRAMVLNGVSDEVGRFENATKKAKCRVDIAKLGKWCLIV
jgi:hypothetical protein